VKAWTCSVIQVQEHADLGKEGFYQAANSVFSQVAQLKLLVVNESQPLFDALNRRPIAKALTIIEMVRVC
jgi:hypothetical protein